MARRTESDRTKQGWANKKRPSYWVAAFVRQVGEYADAKEEQKRLIDTGYQSRAESLIGPRLKDAALAVCAQVKEMSGYLDDDGQKQMLLSARERAPGDNAAMMMTIFAESCAKDPGLIETQVDTRLAQRKTNHQ
jgi:hypothetical protein